MSRLSKFLSLIVVLVFLLACNFVTQPINDAQNLAKTAQALGTAIPIETLQALPSAIASIIPEETLQALPSAAPTLGAIATVLGDITNPQGTPVQEWRGIPIMSQATVGQEFSDTNTYSFKANVTTTEVQTFYNEKLTGLGWTQPFSIPVEEQGGILTFQKDNNTLLVTITFSGGVSTVLLTMA
jgi:peptidoglycan hydrolase-like protein with peptidoglycan-binding domain